MDNMPKMSGRAQRALDVLSNGGRFARVLERDRYTGREQWQYRLYANLCTGVVKGVGISAFYELEKLGLLVLSNSTSVSSYYKLNTGAAQ